MQKKSIIIFLIGTILVLGIIIYGGVTLSTKLKISSDAINQREKNLKNNYQTFIDLIGKYNNKRNDLIKLNNLYYYENLAQNNATLDQFFRQYDTLIGQIVNQAKILDDNCQNMKDNSKCTNYPITYEKAINVYINDLNTYNSLIDKYNNWTKNSKIARFNSQYVNNYIDANEDQKYEGKKE